jgi:hypothetical protein
MRWQRVLVASAGLLLAATANAWSNHALCTWAALSAMPELSGLPPVEVERLDSFLAREAEGLSRLLQQEEQWARQHVPSYTARPDALAFTASGAAPAELRRRFVAAVRINPQSRLSLFLQLPPGQGAGQRPTLAQSEVTTLQQDEVTKAITFVALREGERVAVNDVIATASDEPDYGIDLGIWSDNGTEHGKAYGLGRQSFGNPAHEYDSQAPMHMGFFHESAIVYAAAPFLKRSFPEYRIHLWRSLAAYAMRTGHPYWGWRFAGWALHYVQDLSQPYHARAVAGVGVPRLLWINALDLAGFPGPKARAITFVSNRHLALENFQLHRVRDAALRGSVDDVLLRALRDTSRDAGAAYTDDSPRQVIARQSHGASDAIDEVLVRHLPARYTSDPAYEFGATEKGIDLGAVVRQAGGAAEPAMTGALSELLTQLGRHTRSFVRAMLAALK